MRIVKLNGKVAIRYQHAVKTLQNQTAKVERYHLKFWQGSKRHMTLNTTDYHQFLDVCKRYNLRFTTGNDAPKGGATGDYIEVVRDNRKSFYKTKFEF